VRALLLAALVALGAAPSATFVDRSGDAPGGDISAVRVKAAKDAVRFYVAVSPDTDSLRFWFDTDADARTGDDGFEVRLTVVNVDGDLQSSLERWSRALGVWIDAPTPAPVRAALFSSFTGEIPRIDVGDAATFRFALLGGGYAPDGSRAFDRAPDTGGWRFTSRSHRIVLDHAVGGVALGMRQDEVQRILGTPEQVRARGTLRSERYAWQGMTVAYRRGAVAFVTTTSRADHTTRNVGIGSSAVDVTRFVPGVRCDRRLCVRATQRGSTSFALRLGRVTSVTICAAPRTTLG
jgi:hypothetical protein